MNHNRHVIAIITQPLFKPFGFTRGAGHIRQIQSLSRAMAMPFEMGNFKLSFWIEFTKHGHPVK